MRTEQRQETASAPPVGSSALLAERDRLWTYARQHGEWAALALAADDLVKLRSELHAYREGGVTEEILRRNDGYIKVGRGCVIALASETPANDQAQRPPPETPGRLQQSRTNYLNRPPAQRGGGSLQRTC